MSDKQVRRLTFLGRTGNDVLSLGVLACPIYPRETQQELPMLNGAALIEELHNILTPELIRTILDEYQLSWRGVHGITHWARVLENGLRVASYTGARIPVVALFAVFHDSKRTNEGKDPGHGRRGAEFAKKLNGKVFDLSDHDLALLDVACTYHTHPIASDDFTVHTCWDSDRLDLGRVGIATDPRYLYTDAAKQPELLTWAGRAVIGSNRTCAESGVSSVGSRGLIDELQDHDLKS